MTEGSTSLSDFKVLDKLGEGAYSCVYKVLRHADNEIYALKKVKLPSLSDKEKQNALNEVRLLASVRHENIVAYKEAFWDASARCLCIIQECADAGDLLDLIKKCKKKRVHLREAEIWQYFDGMCRGLKVLHDIRVLHRDLKCANVFLSKGHDGNVISKLGDFNVSKVAKRGLCMTQTGTPYYASPEVWQDMPYDAKSDMWSLGCILYELVTFRPPFTAQDMKGLYKKVTRGQYSRIPETYSQDLSDVISALLQVHPRNRPSVDQLYQMPQMARNTPGLTQIDRQNQSSDLLQTIKLPKSAIDLPACLPKPRYRKIQLDVLSEISDSFEESPAGRHRALPRLLPISSAGGAGGDILDAYLQQRMHTGHDASSHGASSALRRSRSIAPSSYLAGSRQLRLPAVGDGSRIATPHNALNGQLRLPSVGEGSRNATPQNAQNGQLRLPSVDESSRIATPQNGHNILKQMLEQSEAQRRSPNHAASMNRRLADLV